MADFHFTGSLSLYSDNPDYFNTIWTDTAALGTPNLRAGSEDDEETLKDYIIVRYRVSAKV